jgi:hypothetical protein
MMGFWRAFLQRIDSVLGLGAGSSPAKSEKSEEISMLLAPNKRRPWTMMVYMAGDNGKIFDTDRGRIKLMAEMTTVGYRDLMEMGTVGTTDNVAITCLFDTQDIAYLVEVRKGRGMADSAVQQVPEVNTGAPETLQAFIIESMKAYPADHYALVIWNHGTGWLDVDSYSAVRAFDPTGKSNPPLFRATPQKLTAGDTTRPIAYDDSSMDFLDSQDLRAALAAAQAETGERLDLIGMDACLMAMIEGGRELAGFADYFVASQEVEPMAGWPYGPIIAALDGEPGLAAAKFADVIVEEFTKSYGGATREEHTVTQSAIVLARTATTEELCATLVSAMLDDATPTLRRLARRARDETLTFEDRSYRDLGDFAAKLTALTEWDNYPAVTTAAVALHDHLIARDETGPILKVGFLPDYERATGMSVYLPGAIPETEREKILGTYRELAFAQNTGWDKLVGWLLAD